MFVKLFVCCDRNKVQFKKIKLGTAKRRTIRFYTMKTQALRTPRVLITFDDDDKEKPSGKEMRKQVLQDTVDQPFQEPGSVQGRLRTGLLTRRLLA